MTDVSEGLLIVNNPSVLLSAISPCFQRGPRLTHIRGSMEAVDPHQGSLAPHSCGGTRNGGIVELVTMGDCVAPYDIGSSLVSDTAALGE